LNGEAMVVVGNVGLDLIDIASSGSGEASPS